MSDSGRRQRAEAAFGHLQQAASEVIAAAHDALDILDEVVSTADLGDVFKTVNHLGQALRRMPHGPATPASHAQADAAPTGRTAPGSGASDSPLQRISVR